MEFRKIGYGFDSLEPHVDRQTVELHHTKHHKGYVSKLNRALDNYPELKKEKISELIKNPGKIPEKIRTSVLQNGGQALNHDLYFSILKKDVPFSGEIKKAIENDFGSFEKFKEEFTKESLNLFGSGWVFLSVGKKGLEIDAKKNNETPLMDKRHPILTIDVWEHAYYLKYKNMRPDYIDNFFKIINWEKVNELYKKHKK